MKTEPDLESMFYNIFSTSMFDMKNSLNMLIHALDEEFVKRPPGDKEERQRQATLQYEAWRMNSEMIKLIALHQAAKSRLHPHIEEHYFIETMEELLALNDTLLEVSNIRVCVNCEENLTWHYDQDLIGNLIQCILINLSRYAKERIVVSAYPIDNYLAIEIADDSDGFPQEMLRCLEKLNESQLNCENTFELGLFYAHKITNLHEFNGLKGHISIANKPDSTGSIFTLMLP